MEKPQTNFQVSPPMQTTIKYTQNIWSNDGCPTTYNKMIFQVTRQNQPKNPITQPPTQPPTAAAAAANLSTFFINQYNNI